MFLSYEGKPDFPDLSFMLHFIRELNGVKKEYLAEMRIITGVPILATFLQADNYGREGESIEDFK